MPPLKDPRHEAFAAARADGARVGEAYAAVGYVPNSSHACRLNKEPKVAERIAELRAGRRAEIEAVSPRAILAALARIAQLDDKTPSPAAVKEARLTLLELWRLGREADREEADDRREIESTFTIHG